MSKTPSCRICSSQSQERFKAKILSKHGISYYFCENCGFLQTEAPFWLEEAYDESINLSDTGFLLRSLALAEIVSVVIYFLFDKSGRHLDFAGGHGLFTRRMRDIGFDFFWSDKYTANLLARGFEYRPEEGGIELITAFETFEHFTDPLAEIETMLPISRNILFTTDLLPDPVPDPTDWYYYGLEHGQHISFYSLKTLRFIAKKFDLYLYSVRPIYFLTSRRINPAYLKLLLACRKFGLFLYVKKRLKSRAVDDSVLLRNKTGNTLTN
jgi:hypothetical protein